MATKKTKNGRTEKDNQKGGDFMRQKAKKFEKSIAKLLTK